MDGVKLIVRDYGVSISKTGPEVISFQIRIVREDCLRSFPLSEQTENEFDGDAHASNDGFATENFGVHRNASKKWLVDHDYWLLPWYVIADSLFASDIVDSKRLMGHVTEAHPSDNW
jgi:hypothetical protein